MCYLVLSAFEFFPFPECFFLFIESPSYEVVVLSPFWVMEPPLASSDNLPVVSINSEFFEVRMIPFFFSPLQKPRGTLRNSEWKEFSLLTDFPHPLPVSFDLRPFLLIFWYFPAGAVVDTIVMQKIFYLPPW